jgi:hypothetical protein
MIIYGGFRFITSGGNSDATKDARNTIIYALVGLLVVLLVNLLITFVFNQANDINNSSSGAGSSCVDDPKTPANECAGKSGKSGDTGTGGGTDTGAGDDSSSGGD